MNLVSIGSSSKMTPRHCKKPPTTRQSIRRRLRQRNRKATLCAGTMTGLPRFTRNDEVWVEADFSSVLESRFKAAYRRLIGWTALLLVVLGAPLQAHAAGLELKTLDGKTTSLSAQLSTQHPTVVMLWTTYCSVCRRGFPSISAFHDTHAHRDAEVLGIALDGYSELEKVRAFVATSPFSFPTLIAEPATMSAGFERATGEKFTGTPTYLIFNRQRELVAAHSGEVTRDALETFLKKP